MYNQIYGKFSQGTGSWLGNKDFIKFKNSFVDKQILETYEVQIMQDLLRIKKLRKIKEMSVLDIGSGRQALAFENLSAKKVDLIDISQFNINRFKIYKKKNPTKINCRRFDICSNKFFNLKSSYDLIYLHGVIQHTKNPVLAIRNLVKKLNKNGIIWFYFYQLGSSKNIYLQLQRDILKNSLLTLNYVKNFNFRKLSSIEIDGLLDDILADYVHILPSQFYMSLFSDIGLKVIYKKDLYENSFPSLKTSAPSCLIAFKKNKEINQFSIKKYEMLIKKFSVYDLNNYDYLDRSFVSEVRDLKNILISRLKNFKNKRKIIYFLKLLKKKMNHDTLLMSYSLKKNNLKNSMKKIIKILN